MITTKLSHLFRFIFLSLISVLVIFMLYWLLVAQTDEKLLFKAGEAQPTL